jgi:hypothetical protein
LDGYVTEQIGTLFVVLGAVAEDCVLEHLVTHTILNKHFIRQNRLVVAEWLLPSYANILVGERCLDFRWLSWRDCSDSCKDITEL